MIKRILLPFFIMICFHANSQIKYEPGYFITNAGEKIDCLIKNLDWKNNPLKFSYRLNKDAAVQTGKIEDVKEFGITNISKYQRFVADIDSSSNESDELSSNAAPEFKTSEVFLKTLIEGSGTLYVYKQSKLTRFFYRANDTNAVALIYKIYKSADNGILENNTFREQLITHFSCNQIPLKPGTLSYTEPALVKYFIAYNNCGQASSTNFSNKVKRDIIHLSIRPGISSSSLSVDNAYLDKTDYGNKITMRLGIEAEFVLPFNKNKWVVLVEPAYQYFKSSVQVKNKEATADYKSLDIGAGFRYYFFLNAQSKIYLGALYNQSIPFGSKIVTQDRYKPDVGSTGSINLSGGFNYRKLGAEIKYGFTKSVFSNVGSAWRSDYKVISLIFSYRLF